MGVELGAKEQRESPTKGSAAAEPGDHECRGARALLEPAKWPTEQIMFFAKALTTVLGRHWRTETPFGRFDFLTREQPRGRTAGVRHSPVTGVRVPPHVGFRQCPSLHGPRLWSKEPKTGLYGQSDEPVTNCPGVRPRVQVRGSEVVSPNQHGRERADQLVTISRGGTKNVRRACTSPQRYSAAFLLPPLRRLRRRQVLAT